MNQSDRIIVLTGDLFHHHHVPGIIALLEQLDAQTPDEETFLAVIHAEPELDPAAFAARCRVRRTARRA
jgi:hypothetical protein